MLIILIVLFFPSPPLPACPAALIPTDGSRNPQVRSRHSTMGRWNIHNNNGGMLFYVARSYRSWLQFGFMYLFQCSDQKNNHLTQRENCFYLINFINTLHFKRYRKCQCPNMCLSSNSLQGSHAAKFEDSPMNMMVKYKFIMYLKKKNYIQTPSLNTKEH